MLDSLNAVVRNGEMVDQDENSEAGIIRAVIAGERDEFRHLVLANQAMIYALIRRQVSSHEIAEELAQEVFIKAYRSLSQFRFESKFSTWLTRIALNQTNSYFQSRRYKQAKRTDEFEMNTHDRSSGETPGSELERTTRIAAFQQAVAGLKPIFREVIALCGFEGKSYEEVAEILKIPVGTVRSRLNKARLLLKEATGTGLLEEC